MFNKTVIERYFIAEKSESLIFIILGIVAIIISLVFFFYFKSSFHRGFAIPLVLVSLLQIAVGAIVYRKSDNDRINNVYSFDLDPGKLKTEEIPRMEVVMKNLAIYRWVEISLVITGLLLIIFFRTQIEQSFWYGFGIGLTVQSIAMLVADFFSEKRGYEYLLGLKTFFKI